MDTALLANVLYDYVATDSSIALLVLDREGQILQTNAYVRNLTGQDCVGGSIRDILVDFSGSFDLTATLTTSDAPLLVNVVTAQGLPQTFYFRFVEHGEHVVAVGEVNALEVEELRKTLLDTNISLNNLSRELHKKNAELTRLNELKNSFLGMAAHDLRNPLGAIRMYTDYLLESASRDLQTDHVALLNDIRGLSEFMLRMINDLLDISVIESGKLRLDLWPNDLVDLVRQIMGLNRVFAEKKGIVLTLGDAPEMCKVVFDSAKIKQVLNNLISNAIKFSHAGSEVTVFIAVDEEVVTVTVYDRGQGIPAEEMAVLFQPFAKMSVKSTAGEPCTGLGLAICQKIAVAHKGKITARSEAGVGSEFCLILPLHFKKGEER